MGRPKTIQDARLTSIMISQESLDEADAIAAAQAFPVTRSAVLRIAVQLGLQQIREKKAKR